MRAGEPFSALSLAVGHALATGLPDVEYDKVDWAARRQGEHKTERAKRRPEIYDVDVRLFNQTWGSTALGFGGIGGAAMTDAYTTVVFGPGRAAAVYFAGGFAYLIEHPNLEFDRDVARGIMEPVAKAHAKYERQP